MKAWKSLVLTFSVMSLFSSSVTVLYAENLLPEPQPQFSGFAQSGQLTWFDTSQPSSKALEALSFIASSSIHGLDPEDYHLTQLHRLVKSADAKTIQYADALLSESLLNLIHDLAIGRMDPAIADPDWHIPRDSVEPSAILQQALLSNHLRNQLDKLIPKSPQYHQLTAALSRYQGYVERGGWQLIPATPLLRPGDHHQNIPLIRARLAVEEPVLSRQDLIPLQRYDALLLEAVKRFQTRHGLKVDGIIGSNTQAALNIPATDLVKQIKLNLERYRWLPDEMGNRYLLVNIGSHQLTAMEHDHIALSMKVIVGQRKRATPSFNSEMTHIVINPYWNVPSKLARRDLLPKQKADPDYFFLHDFNIYLKQDGGQTAVDPYLVDWDEVSARNFPYRLQQRPGKYNALGRLKFMFPNPWNIYLHDTPDKTLFEKSQRNFSSGCIRVEDPLALAGFSINQHNSQDWIQQQIASQENRGRPLDEPLPVYAVYFTVWPYDGEIAFAQDHYRRDQRMAKFL